MGLSRQECEAKILEKMKEIEEIVLAYNPDNKYLCLFITDTSYNSNNDNWISEDGTKGSGYDKPIDFMVHKDKEDADE